MPSDGGAVHVDTASQAVGLVVTSNFFDELSVLSVQYSVNGLAEPLAETEPFPAVVDNVGALSGVTVRGSANTLPVFESTGIATFKEFDVANAVVATISADNNGDGYPDDPYALGSSSVYVNARTPGGSEVVVTSRRFAPGSGEVSVGAALASNPEHYAAVTLPPGLLSPGESGVVIVGVAEDLTGLVGAQAGDPVVTGLPAGGLVANGLFMVVEILISNDDGLTFAPIDAARLSSNPLRLVNFGTLTTGNDNVGLFDFPLDGSSSPLAMSAAVGGQWTEIERGTTAALDHAFSSAATTGIFGFFNTPNAMNIESVINAGSTSLNGSNSSFSLGGSPIEVRVANATGLDLGVLVDGLAVSVVQAAEGQLEVLTFNAPAATAIAAPQFRHAAAVQVFDTNGAAFDADEQGLVYRGPKVDSITPDSGADIGGTNVTIAGEGFNFGLTAAIGSSVVTNLMVANSESLSGQTTAQDLGTYDVSILLSSNYKGALVDGFTVTPSAPVAVSAFPDVVYNDGGYQVYINGTSFLDPDAISNSNTTVYFTDQEGFQDIANDFESPEVKFVDDTRLVALTPVFVGTGPRNVYVVTELDGSTLSSNLLSFEFLDAGAAPFTISDITPNAGGVNGGELVQLSGSFPSTAEVFFGPNAALVLQGSGPTAIAVTSPSFDSILMFLSSSFFAVDVRVQDANAPGIFAVLPAPSVFNSTGGYTYLGEVVTPVMASLSGKVIGPGGEALTCAAVELTNLADNSTRIATTDLSGGYVFSDLEPSVYSAAVFARGISVEAVTTVALGEGESAVADLVVVEAQDARSVEGRVTDAATNEGIAGALVEGMIGDLVVAESYSCATGDYGLPLPAVEDGGSADVVVRYSSDNYEMAQQMVTVETGETEQVNQPLQKAISFPSALGGSVVDAMTDPMEGISGARLTLAGPANLTTESGSDGAFMFPAVLGGRYQLSVSASGYEGAAHSVEVPGGGTLTDQLFILESSGEAPGSATDLNGDGTTDAVDVQLVINGALDIDIGDVDADVNNDDQVDAIDVQLVINAVLGVGR